MLPKSSILARPEWFGLCSQSMRCRHRGSIQQFLAERRTIAVRRGSSCDNSDAETFRHTEVTLSS